MNRTEMLNAIVAATGLSKATVKELSKNGYIVAIRDSEITFTKERKK
jgi:hypothetical protein